MEEFAPTTTLQFVSFQLAEAVFAVDVTKVREVLDLPAITRVPKTPPHMLGVINLRGRVVPVVDLRTKFGMASAERTVDSCIVIFEVALANEVLIVGALTDSVREVAEVKLDQIAPPPRLGTGLKIEFIRGMIGNDGAFTILLDIDRVFAKEDFPLPDDHRPTSDLAEER